jgi:endonuclease/exonuclease/phosphatase family metal-dependent hydrolase
MRASSERLAHLVGERTNYVLTASRLPIAAVVRASEFEVPYGERVLGVVIDVDGRPLELVNTHVPDGSGNGWRKVEHFEGLYRYLARTWSPEGRPRILCGDFNSPRRELPAEWSIRGDRRRTASWSPTEVNAGTPLSGA